MEKNSLKELLKDMGYPFEIQEYKLMAPSEKEKSYITKIWSSIRSETDKTLSDSQVCDLWVRRFEKLTHTKWIVEKTFPNTVYIQYKKKFKCQHSSLFKSRNPAFKDLPRSRDKDCKAKLDITLYLDTETTKENSEFINKILTACITVITKTYMYACILVI